MIILWAIGVALFMANLRAQNATPDLLAAVRTTIVVILGWSFACCRYGFQSWNGLTWPIRLILIVSALAVILAWLLHLLALRKSTASGSAVMDRINVGVAIVISLLFLWQQTSAQAATVGVSLVCGSLFIAFAKR